MTMRIFTAFVAVIVCLKFSPALAQSTIVHPRQALPLDHYMVGLIKLAMEHLPNDYTLEEKGEVLTHARMRELLMQDQLSVIWMGTSKALDADFLPVHIPAYKGLMGHRIFIIRQGDQARFDRVNTLDDLRGIVMGQGNTWSDTKILQNAGFKVVTSVKTEGLYHMLDGERFNAFPRGAHEPWNEIKAHPNLPLTVEKHLVLKYTMPYYFYVSKNNRQLARDLTRGLEAAIADGSFDEHFYSDPEVKLALELSHLHERKIIEIPNPNVSNDIPVDRPELWLDLSRENNLLGSHQADPAMAPQ